MGSGLRKGMTLFYWGRETSNPLLPLKLTCVSRAIRLSKRSEERWSLKRRIEINVKIATGPHHRSDGLRESSISVKDENFRPGDRFLPLGVRGTQKLKDFFIDHKVPRFERPSVPLLISEERIAWVVGYRIDERVKNYREDKESFESKVL